MKLSSSRTPETDGKRVRPYAAFRTILITYGIVAYTYLVSRFDSGEGPRALGISASAQSLMLVGLVLQLLLSGIRLLIERHVSDRDQALQMLDMVDLVADAATVLLFALGTFGAITARVQSET
jgi:hypothetical protein